MTSFDNLPRDGSRAIIPVGRREQFRDATGTPVESPVAISTSWTTLLVPDGAAEIQMESADTIFRVAADSSGANGYYLVPIGSKEIVSCAYMTAIYVYGEAAGTLSFKFRMVKD